MTAILENPEQPLILTIDDPATLYAERVVDGKIIAGPHVRASCRRHLDDLERGPSRGLYWDTGKVKSIIGYFYYVLRLNGSDFEGLPFELELWQAFVQGSIFGWIDAETGYRRFRTAYIETAKGSGKSPLAAGTGLYGLCSDGENRAEIYAAATKKDQAQILFRDAVAMVNQSPDLESRLRPNGSAGNEWQYYYPNTHSFFKMMSSDKKQSGPRPYFGLIDEFHEHPDNTVVEMIRAGFKFRKQPLIYIITNSGDDTSGPCFEYHQYGIRVANQDVANDRFFSYICALDKDEDPFRDEKCWVKANPSLGTTIQPGYLRDQITEAKGIPSKESTVRRLNFCQWVGALNPWISGELWRDCAEVYTLDDMHGRACIAGLDLSSTTDLTALVLAFMPVEEDKKLRLFPFFWIPSIDIREKQEKDGVPYQRWIDEGYLMQTPGKAISKLHILSFLDKLRETIDIQSIAYDRWRIEDLKSLAEDHNIELPEMDSFGQGYQSMAPAIDAFEERMLNNALTHPDNPVLNFCASGAVCEEDPAGNRKLSKRKAKNRIDGIVAAVMAVGTIARKEDDSSVYDERGILAIEFN